MWVEICPWVSNVPFPFFMPRKKSNPVFSKATTNSSVEFLFHIKAQAFGAHTVCCRPYVAARAMGGGPVFLGERRACK